MLTTNLISLNLPGRFVELMQSVFQVEDPQQFYQFAELPAKYKLI
jgi:hypothetical protein